MTKRISHVSNLPEWFDLAKYEIAGSLDAIGWYEQLIIRRELIRVLFRGTRIESIFPGYPAISKHEAKKLTTLIHIVPILNISVEDIQNIFSKHSALYELKTHNPQYSFGVRQTTVYEHYATERFIEKEKRNYARNFFSQLYEEDNKSEIQFKNEDWIDEPIDAIVEDFRYDINIRVNTLLPDKILIEQFERLLSNVRVAQMHSELKGDNVRKPDFSKWILYGVLPYLDLKIWKLETGKKLTKQEIAYAISPYGDRGEDLFRKTTEETAEILISVKYLETLAAYAASEIAEQNNT